MRFLAGPRRSRATSATLLVIRGKLKVDSRGRRMTPWCPICKTGGESTFIALNPEHFLPRFGFPTHAVKAWHCKDCGYIVTDPPLRNPRRRRKGNAVSETASIQFIGLRTENPLPRRRALAASSPRGGWMRVTALPASSEL